MIAIGSELGPQRHDEAELVSKLESWFTRQGHMVERRENQLSLLGWEVHSGKIEICIRVKPNAIIMEAFSVEPIPEPRPHDLHFYLNRAQNINEQLITEDVVFWVEPNKNFGARRIWPMEFLSQATDPLEKLISNSIIDLQRLLSRCSNLNQGEEQQKDLSSREFSVEKRLALLQELKFQFQVNRKQRQRASATDFNNSKIKTISELLTLKERCQKEQKNYMQALRQHQLRNPVNPAQALNSYNRGVEAYRKRENEKKIREVLQQKEKILNPIKIRSRREVGQLAGTFSHIEVVESQFSIILSLNLKTAEFLAQEKVDLSMKEQNCILVKKRKCEGCDGESEARKRINESVFENEKEMLLLMNPYAHNSICSFYVEQYAERKLIQEIYSKKLPSDPVSKFVEGKQKNSIRWIHCILKFMTEVAEGVEFLSSHEILHRDLKPTNVMLDDRSTAKIIDFGSSCPSLGSALEASLSSNFDIKLRSTKGYFYKYGDLPPEIGGKYKREEYERHPSFDVYSLGAILEFLMPSCTGLTGAHSTQLLDYIEYLIKKCMDVHPDDRLPPLEVAIFLRELTRLAQKIGEPSHK